MAQNLAEAMKKALEPNSGRVLIYVKDSNDTAAAMMTNGTYGSAQNISYRVTEKIYDAKLIAAISDGTKIPAERLLTPEYRARLIAFAVACAGCSSTRIPGVQVMGASASTAEHGCKEFITANGLPSSVEVISTKQAKNLAWRYRELLPHTAERKQKRDAQQGPKQTKKPKNDNGFFEDGEAALDFFAAGIAAEEENLLI